MPTFRIDLSGRQADVQSRDAMKGDFSRSSFRPDRHYTGVFLQQGRPQLDSDWNEQTSITSAALRALARDLFGPHGGPGDGFAISSLLDQSGRPSPWDFVVGAGCYYVQGIRCLNATAWRYRAVTDALGCGQDNLDVPGSYLAYLEVWDREVSVVEDPDLLEPAMDGVDASTRLQVVWRVRLLCLDDHSEVEAESGSPERSIAVAFPPGASRLRARVDPDGGGYRGAENHLYRVEIHAGGKQGDATFVWSRDNGSVVAPVQAAQDDRIVIDPRWRGSQERRFDLGCWVEPQDDIASRCGRTAPLLRIEAVEDGGRLVVSPGWPLESPDPATHPLIRRWDHAEAGDPNREGAVPLEEGPWIDLENGIQIAFEEGGDYRAGDSWVIPARAVTNWIEWPTGSDGPSPRPPYCVDHHRAPLALVTVDGGGAVRVALDLRRVFRRIDDLT